MPNTDPRVDAYIEHAAAFARPILARLRAAVYRGCPDASETIKWGMPFFMHQSRLLANMAAFKQHCAFGFWKAGDAVASDRRDQAMCSSAASRAWPICRRRPSWCGSSNRSSR